jgi:hypothetical protein
MGTHGFRAQHATIVAVVTREHRIIEACADGGSAAYRAASARARLPAPKTLTALLEVHAHSD